MDYSKRWKIIDELGEGGQGKVFRVSDNSKFQLEDEVYPAVVNAVREFAYGGPPGAREKHLAAFQKAVANLVLMEDHVNQSALKILHKPEDARDADLAEERIKREIKAMTDISHPNLLKIIDADPDAKWFVSEYHPKGSLAKNQAKHKGDFAKALRAFRPLVEGVSELHARGYVHRDIKPANVFIDNSDNLVLGDFGLVFFTDQKHTRISNTWENVGSRDWMPAWATGKIEDIRPTFDVFCLGKLLWSMVSGSPFLRLWYFDTKEFNLEKMFPDDHLIKLANPLFMQCIVQFEKDCLRNATELLGQVDLILKIIDKNADLIVPEIEIERSCRVCGMGTYRLIVDRRADSIRNFGINPVAGHTLKIFTCNYCGHVQLFDFDKRRMPKAWKSS